MSDWIKKLKVKYLKAKHAKICDLEAHDSKIANLSANGVTANEVTAKSVTSETLVVSNTATIKNLVSENGQIGNLQVTNLNGRNLACQERAPTFNNVNSNLVTDNPFEFPPTAGFNRIVWDNLVAQTLRQKDELAGRLQCGRLQVKYIQNEFGCVQCPPDGLEECTPICVPPAPPGEVCPCPQETGTCPSVPLNVFGIQSFLPFRTIQCDAFESITQLISSVSYNLDVKNVTGTLANRVVTILIQSGHLDGNGDFVYNEIDFGNRQFTATLDTTYGEKYTGTVALDTKFIKEIIAQPNNGAMIQLVVFAEDGVEIDVRLSKSRQATTNGPVDASFVATPPPHFLTIRQFYSYRVNEIFSIRSTLNITLSALDTRWACGGLFSGQITNQSAAIYFNFGIERDRQGNYILNANMGDGVTATPGGPYATATSSPPEPNGLSFWSLTALNSDIPFPNFLEPNTTYELNIERGNTIPVPNADWTFTITKQSTGQRLVLGTISTRRENNFILGAELVQFTEYLTPTSTAVNCPSVSPSTAVWGFIQANSDETTPGGSDNVGAVCPNSFVQLDNSARTATIIINQQQ